MNMPAATLSRTPADRDQSGMRYHSAMLPELGALQTIDRVADEFESLWLSGDRPAIRDFLDRVPAVQRAALLSELIILDVEFRRRFGEEPSTTEYRAEYPEFFGGAPDADPAWSGFQTVGRYVVLSELPADGQARVLRAVHPLGFQVVLKFLHDTLPRHREILIEVEAKVLAQLRHERIAHVIDLDRHEGQRYAVIGYIHGQTLEQFAVQRRLQPREIALLVADLARTLAAAHRAGVAHLDLKPRNVIIDAAGRPHLIDFGGARLFNSARDDTNDGGPLVGTPAFMSPEQARGEGERVNQRSDLFGLGAILYFLLSSRAPFDSPSAMEALAKAADGRIPPLPEKTPSRLARECMRALSEDPDQRHADAEELASRLESFAKHRPFVWKGLAAAAALLVAAAVWQFMSSGRQPAADPQLTVLCFENEQWTPANEALAHRVGSSLRVSSVLSPGEFGAAFLIDADGSVAALPGARDAADKDRVLATPVDSVLTVTGGDGNRAVVCLTSRDRAPTEADVRELVAGAAWPEDTLPDGVSVVATGTSVRAAYAVRSKPVEVASDDTPDASVRRALEHVRSGAVRRGFGFAAIAAGFRSP